ncbi:Hypothetical protein PHPALM_5499 [Phytophthora palmivora]|uniref:DDE-1 domain-containing protein n=1 Tax=Phytophthora palmivora TaxID=4796 RepID=A0A2P4YHG0_9STRA|nr:Hypothetical protein PHPALM_5499 [Phytophthora palmivora]
MERLQQAVDAVNDKRLSLRAAATRFSVSKSKIHRRTSGQVELTSRNGPEPILTSGEINGVVKAVMMRTRHGQCYTKDELGLFIRAIVENSPHSREIPENFPSKSYIQRFVVKHAVDFSSRRAQSLEVCRAKASTVEKHFNNFKEVMSSVADIPTSRIWNLDETGMSCQILCTRKKVLAAKHMRANVQESNDRTNVSALVCVNADGGFAPPFFILPAKKIRVRDTAEGLKGSMFAASESVFLTTKLFIQYFEWFVQVIPPERPVLVIADGYKCHFSSRTLQYARKHSILLYALPAHTSQFLQPQSERSLGAEKQTNGR